MKKSFTLLILVILIQWFAPGGEGGREKVKENATLKTRFKYKQLVFGPLIFDRGSQQVYRYEIIGRKDWKGKAVYIVEAVTKGVRFPSKLYYEEAYQDKRGRMIVQSLGNVTFRDYQFFAIETRVTRETRE